MNKATRGLEGARVIVTGGAQGIGCATALEFLSHGCRVAILDRRPAPLDSDLESIQVDISRHDQVSSAFRKIDSIFGGVDVLVANAGISIRRPFSEITVDDWETVISTNLTGVFLCCQEALRRMSKQSKGMIITMGSTNGIEGHKLYADYNASKAGVILLTKTIALEYAPYIRAVCICPGYVLTEMQRREYTPDMLHEVNASIPLRRHATPEEIAKFIVFACSSEAGYITGTTLVIDGGETAGV